MKPQVVVFSSSSSYGIAEGIASHLKNEFIVHPWKGEFFGENKTTPLWTFFKKLFHYDYAVIVLSNDKISLEHSSSTSEPIYTPVDNVLFELGASMARLGPQKTILVVPDIPKIKLPGYFDDVKPNLITYDKQLADTEQSKIESTRVTADQIRAIIHNSGPTGFHAELPAQGLAHAYILNFFNPIIKSEAPQVFTIDGKTLDWSTEAKMTFTILIPDEIMGRTKADDFFRNQIGCYPTNFKLKDGRDLGVYALPRESSNDPIHIIDIPTTLLTAENIIKNIENFWRETDSDKVVEVDSPFMDALKQREILNFRRTLSAELSEKNSYVYILSTGDLQEHIQSIIQQKPKGSE